MALYFQVHIHNQLQIIASKFARVGGHRDDFESGQNMLDIYIEIRVITEVNKS